MMKWLPKCTYLSEILHIYSHAKYELRPHLSLQASRFSDKQSHTPGPGAYNLQKRSDWLRENQPQKALPPDIQVQEGMKDGSVSGRDFVIICHVEKQFLIDTETFMFFLWWTKYNYYLPGFDASCCYWFHVVDGWTTEPLDLCDI